MSLVKTSVLNGIATLIRILTAIGINKVLAVYVGPAGYALVGQFSNAISMAGAVAGGAIGTGVTKFTAEHFDDEDRQRSVWRAGARYVLIATVLTSLSVALFSGAIAQHLLGNASHRTVLLLLAGVLPLMSLNGLLLAIMNGKKEVRAFVLQNIVASICGALIAAALAASFGLSGALAALALNQSVALFVTIYLCRHKAWMKLSSFVGEPAIGAAKPLFGFALMSLTSAVVGPLSQMLVRDQLIQHFGEAPAGEWQAVFKISELYLLLFTSTLSVYYLPRLAEIRERGQLWLEIRKVYALVLPVAIAAACTIFALRRWITVTLFTEAFFGMLDLFAWQLVGDVLKIGSWILGYVMIGRAMVRWFVATEVVFSASWVVLSLALTGPLGLEGAPAAFAVNYGLYWLFMAWLIRREMARASW